MEEKCIKIDELALYKREGMPMTFQGKHSGASLSGINLEFTLSRPEHIRMLEELFGKEYVQVDDPFAMRSYEATLRELSHSYTEGKPEYQYTAEIRELDLPPKFEVLEIEGHAFAVLEYSESDEEDDSIGMHAVFKLTKQQFSAFRELLRPGAVLIRRRGVDEEPIPVRYGGAMYWSEHNEEGEVYYKQIVRFFPPDLPASENNLAVGVQQDNLAFMVEALTARFEALASKLTQKKVISEEFRSSLMGDNWQELIEASRLSEIFRRIDKVQDASKYL
jgi:hypothetical protein